MPLMRARIPVMPSRTKMPKSTVKWLTLGHKILPSLATGT